MPSDLAEKIVEVPRSYESGTKSTACLLKELGFPDRYRDLSIEEIERALRQKPQLAELWLERAHDQLFAGGWGIDRDCDNFKILHYSDGRALVIHDRWRACAEFIVRYIGLIGEVLTRFR